MNRRSFREQAVLAPGAFALMDRRSAQPAPAPAAGKSGGAAEAAFVGVQIAAHSFFDEGIDHYLNLRQESGGAGVLPINNHSCYGAMDRPHSIIPT